MRPCIEEIRQYVRAHIAETHTVKDLAAHFHTTAGALHMAWIRSQEPISLGQFVAKVRITVAESWQREHPEARCKEIAHSAGFRSLDAASRSSKRVIGESMKDHFHRK